MNLAMDELKGQQDVPHIKAFLVGRKHWDSTRDYWSAGKSTVGTYHAMFDSDPSYHRFMRDKEGDIQAYVWLCPESIDTVDGEGYSWRVLTHPGKRTLELLEALIKYAEEHLPLLIQSDIVIKPMRTVAYGQDDWLARLLESFGYKRESAQEVYMQRSLVGDIDEPVLAAGYTIRAFNTDTDLIQRSGVQSDAFAGLVEPNDWSLENTRRFIRWFEGREDLDLAAVSASGEFASFGLFLVDPVTLVGELDPVGTRVAHQRKGLSKAVLLSGLKYLKVKGMKKAVVRTTVDNLSAIGLYESVGFRIVDKLYSYVKDPVKNPVKD